MSEHSSASVSAAERALIDIAIRLNSRLDTRDICATVLDAAERLFDARSSWVLLRDDGGRDLVTVDRRGPDAESYAGARVPIASASIVSTVLRSGQPLFVPDAHAEMRWYDPGRVHGSALRSVLTVPLMHQDAAIGVLGLDSARFTAATPPTAADVERLRAMAAQAALALRNARLLAAVEEERRRLRRVVQERQQLRGQVGHFRRELRGRTHPGSSIVGESAALSAVLSQVSVVAPADTTVLLIGETGTGKELIAHAIHDGSRRAAQAFIAVNCAAVPDSLVESELFGYEKGAFTGAVARTPGKFELADRGTILLDEVGDLPAAAQAKLLRVLHQREVQRVGGTRPVPINVRLVAATNRDLEAAMAQAAFRPDLFYRLSVFPIHLPPLRERREDIEPLARYFSVVLSEREGKRPPDFAPGVAERLADYDWPGNIRELQNVIERAVVLAQEGLITSDLIAVTRRPATIAAARAPRLSPAPEPAPQHARSVEPFSEAERRAILEALQAAGWRVSGRGGAADALKLKPTTLHAKMKRLGIRRPSVRRHEGVAL